ncbi:MAG: 3-deoxy-D-manno-octulosonic acid kinase, partial [Lysobacter sp.]|nr:3-deoxy-D-manno-octulosonic acid kinase [Lysobacter sp.]
MMGYDATEGLLPFRDDSGYGAILFDLERVKQASPDWFSPSFWGERARPVESGGRGGAWFVDAPFGPSVLRCYLRGGLIAQFNRDRYWWRGAAQTRSFAEFRLTRAAVAKGVPVPQPIAAYY